MMRERGIKGTEAIYGQEAMFVWLLELRFCQVSNIGGPERSYDDQHLTGILGKQQSVVLPE
jgi:hypothetical protein